MVAKNVIYRTSADFRKLADEIWDEMREYEKHGDFKTADVLRNAADGMHNVAREMYKVEQLRKNIN